MYATISIDPEQFKDIDDSKDFACLLQIEENVLVFPGEVIINLYQINSYFMVKISLDW